MYNLLFNDEKQKEMETFFLKDLAKDGYVQNHPKKSLISPETADCIYIIISGECRQVMYGPNGKKVSYFRLTPGTIFGEMDYFDQNRTCVKTECLTDVKLSVIYRETLEKRLKEKPEIYQYFLHSEARKFRLLMLKIAEEKFNPVLGQLSAFLYRLSILSEDLKKERIQFTLTHEEIADRLGCSRISVTNNMNRLVEKNIVAYEGRYLIVKDKKRLMELINLF
jgi:CRP-like cAMP-binding protein